MRRRILWVAAALVLVAIPALIGVVALRDDDGSSSARRSAALVAAGGAGHNLTMQGLLPVGDDREIELNSWSWGVTNGGSAYSTTSGAGTGKVSFHDLSFTKKVDAASPKLFLHCAKGTHFQKVTLTSRKAGETPQEYLVITLEEVLITSIQLAGSGPGDEIPSEQVTLNFAKATMETKSVGDAKEEPATHSYDLRTAKVG